LVIELHNQAVSERRVSALDDPTCAVARKQYDAWAAQIATAIRQRKKIAEERRKQEQERARRNNDRALARYHRLRGEFPEQAARRVKEMDRMFDAIRASNAAAREVNCQSL
jgi:hypothetical protein